MNKMVAWVVGNLFLWIPGVFCIVMQFDPEYTFTNLILLFAGMGFVGLVAWNTYDLLQGFRGAT